MKVDNYSNLHICDRCRKPIKKWQQKQLVKREYFPGPNHENCSSDIKTKLKVVIELCPDCMGVFEDMFDRFKEEK